MDDILPWIIGSALLDAIIGCIGIITIWVSKKNLEGILYLLIAFAAGSLIGGAFLHLLPEALENQSHESVFIYTITGFFLFVVFECYLHWHSCEKCEIHPFTYTMLFGDALHNFIDGLVLTASFLVSIPLGIATVFAILTHELPQQLGVFGVLVKGGLSRGKAVLYSFLAQSTILLGALVGYFFAGSISGLTTIMIPFAAGGFIYIASSDLIPEMHKAEGWRKIIGLLFFLAGLGLLFVLKS